jgi:glycosyltransferase involved in cell wall biosynthesis
MNKISMCTVCMNRATYLYKTLPVNIIENINHPNIEFIILDYNSGDGLEHWAMKNLQSYIQSGVVKYYKTYEPEYFSMSHSKNMALRLATGEIACMIDADNFAGINYARWVDSIFSIPERKAIVTTIREDFVPNRDQGGKLCFRMDHVHLVKGFDESFVSHGFDDVDMVNRLEMTGGSRIYIEDADHLKCIEHSNEERLQNYSFTQNLVSVYLFEPDDSSEQSEQRVLYLFNDNTFFEVAYIFNNELEMSMFSMGGWTLKDGEKKGVFEKTNNHLKLIYNDKTSVAYQEQGLYIVRFDHGIKLSWKTIPPDDGMYTILVLAYSECKNRNKFTQNNKEGCIVNQDGWGRGTVYCNFDTSNPIIIQ